MRTLEIAPEGDLTHLKGFGFVKLFRKDFKKGASKHYIFYRPDEENLQEITRQEFLTIHDTHWGIESYHRAIKQVCGIGRFQVRKTQGMNPNAFGFTSLERCSGDSNTYFLLSPSLCSFRNDAV